MFYFLALEFFLIPVDEGHCVGIDGVLRFDCEVGCNVVKCLVPCSKMIPVHERRVWGGSRLAVLHFFRLECLILIIHEGNRVLVYRLGVSSRVGGSSCCSNYIRCPAVEGVGVLGCSRFGRRFARVGRCGTILNQSALQLRAIVIDKRNGVFLYAADRTNGMTLTARTVIILCFRISSERKHISRARGFSQVARPIVSYTGCDCIDIRSVSVSCRGKEDRACRFHLFPLLKRIDIGGIVHRRLGETESCGAGPVIRQQDIAFDIVYEGLSLQIRCIRACIQQVIPLSSREQSPFKPAIIEERVIVQPIVVCSCDGRGNLIRQGVRRGSRRCLPRFSRYTAGSKAEEVNPAIVFIRNFGISGTNHIVLVSRQTPFVRNRLIAQVALCKGHLFIVGYRETSC